MVIDGERATDQLRSELVNLSKELKELSRRLEVATNAAQETTIKFTLFSELITARHREHDPNGANGGWIRKAVWRITNGRCFYCDHALADIGQEIGEVYREFHVDHLVAKANGGPDHLSNYVPACGACNAAKSAKPFAEFFLRKRSKIAVIEGGKDEPDKSAAR